MREPASASSSELSVSLQAEQNSRVLELLPATLEESSGEELLLLIRASLAVGRGELALRALEQLEERADRRELCLLAGQ